jgi:hypothetical protein
MSDNIQGQILGAILIALKPLARILLRHGIGYREFSEISKTAFVDVGTSEYGLRGRPTNISRVAVMTGLTRKEVRRIRDKISNGEHSVVVKTTPLSEVLHRWHSENEFIDSTGRPARLPFVGESKSFSNLVKRFGGDVPPGAMRTELRRVGAIKEEENGDLVAVSRTIYPKGTHEKVVASFVHAVYPLISTIAHNVNPDRKDESWAQMTTFSQNVRSSDVGRIRRINFDRLSELAESIDDLFIAYESLHEHEQEKSPQDKSTVAVGVFYFEERDSKMKESW